VCVCVCVCVCHHKKQKQKQKTSRNSRAYGDAYGEGDTIRVDVDLTKRTISFSKNGNSIGVAFRNVRGPVYPAVSFTATDAQIRIVALKKL